MEEESTTLGDADDSASGGCGIDDGSELSLAYQKIQELEKVIEDLHKDFGAKRATFKELFLQKEEELGVERRGREVLEEANKRLEDDLNEAKSQVTIAEFQKENDLDLERAKYHQDLTAMRLRFEDKLKSLRQKYEDEIGDLKAVKERQEKESEDGPSAVFSAMTKSFARKFNSGGIPSSSSESLQEIPDSPDKAVNKKAPNKYAGEDAEILRSLVVQLEDEVKALKEKLRQADDELGALQGAQASIVKGNTALSVLLQGEDVQCVLSKLDDKLQSAKDVLEPEKSSSRADLEMYVAFSNAQKTLLTEELDKIKRQLRELRGSYELERRRHSELKETWEKANEQFLVTHNEYVALINRYRQVLTPAQLEVLTAKEAEDSSSPTHLPPTHLTHPSPTHDEETTAKPCAECELKFEMLEKQRSDLLKAAKLRNEMEEEWGRIVHEYQNKLGSLEEQIGTYDMILLELNTSCSQSMETMEGNIRRLGFERDSIQKRIEKVETENEILKGKHVAHSMQLQNEYISLPTDVMELQEMVLRMKDELIGVAVGKEGAEGEAKFLRHQIRALEQEQGSLQDSLNTEINSLREDCAALASKLTKSEDERRRLDKSLAELKAKVVSGETQVNKLLQLKDKNAEILKEKETLENEIGGLRNQVATLRKELTNSEELQKDLIALSKSLQVNLESFRQSDTEIRWQHPDDVSHCNSCRKFLSETREKINCKHCGRIFCPACVEKTVRRGNRDNNVCGICHTLLSHDSAPYFSTLPPHSPD